MTDIDQIRARFQPKTRGGDEYDIYGQYADILYGRVGLLAVSWSMDGEPVINHYRENHQLIHKDMMQELIDEARKLIRPIIDNPSLCLDPIDIAKTIKSLCNALEQEMKK